MYVRDAFHANGKHFGVSWSLICRGYNREFERGRGENIGWRRNGPEEQWITQREERNGKRRKRIEQTESIDACNRKTLFSHFLLSFVVPLYPAIRGESFTAIVISNKIELSWESLGTTGNDSQNNQRSYLKHTGFFGFAALLRRNNDQFNLR